MWRHYVYVHKKADNGDVFYVGKGTVRKRSKSVDYSRANCATKRNNYWNNTVNKHGFIVKIIASFLSDEDSQEFEKLLISEYGKENLVNLTDGGDGHCGFVASDELRKKRSISAQRPRSQKWIKSIRKARENGGNGGVVKKGDRLSESWRENISNAVMGKNNPMYGKTTAAARKVINIKNGDKFDSVSLAAESIGVKMKTLYNKLSGHRTNNTNLRFV